MLTPAPAFAILIAFILLFGTSCTVPTSQPIGEPTALVETYWILYSISEEKIAPDEGTPCFLRFEAKDRDVKGFAGCNRFSGKYNLTGDRLKIYELSVTRMSCPHMELENYLLKTLEEVTTYRIAGEILTLYKGDKAVATFRTGSADELPQAR
ncbi:META domain-containing protein [Pontibacter ruber]|uniref:META domain-containing protein n=1 Tax=Pontibacter ruber TaxID=1343895 RepID=A0ABW5D1N8_9BACT|nr:META domain-containing protein [Pontibacter ruber]